MSDEPIKPYPSQVCRQCAEAAGATPKDRMTTMWIGQCDVCKKRRKSVCSPRNYGYPDFKGFEPIRRQR